VRPIFTRKRGRRQGGSTVPDADDKTKSTMAADVWSSKMSKGNWVGRLNARLG
jgi:hypothetical protein